MTDTHQRSPARGTPTLPPGHGENDSQCGPAPEADGGPETWDAWLGHDDGDFDYEEGGEF